MKIAIVHIVAGPIGAGKTTYAQDLAESTNGVRFSIDDWMIGLFGADLPRPLDPGWVFERVNRCSSRIMQTGLAVASRGVAVVLDLGLAERDQRSLVASAVLSAGHPVNMHWMDAPPALRWARVDRRNKEEASTFAFAVTRPMFDFMEARVEEPFAEELATLNGRRISGGGTIDEEATALQ